MPKEFINSALQSTINMPVPGNPDAAQAIPGTICRAEVGWSKEADNWVSLVTMQPGQADRAQLYENWVGAAYAALEARFPHRQEQGDYTAKEVAEAMLEVDRGYTGWYVHLDRLGVNRLIRVLRRARDDAMGKDA